MGETKNALIRVVLDTNVLVSALLFSGTLSKIVSLWIESKIVPLFSRETFQELRAVLHYSKFALSEAEIKRIISSEILPFCEVVEKVRSKRIICRDPDDEKFVQCALHGKAHFLITGDKDLLALLSVKGLKIVDPRTFLVFFD